MKTSDLNRWCMAFVIAGAISLAFAIGVLAEHNHTCTGCGWAMCEKGVK